MSTVNLKDPALGICLEVDCKAKSTRFNFCIKHFNEFKFGVIRKTGAHPRDYETKSRQYAKLVARSIK